MALPSTHINHPQILLSILFESKKTFATFEVNIYIYICIRVLCTTDYQIFYFATKNFQYSHKKKSNPTGQPTFLDALFSDNSYSYVLPFRCIIEALNSSLKSGTVLQVHMKTSDDGSNTQNESCPASYVRKLS